MPARIAQARWTEAHGTHEAYVPSDITAPWHNPVGVWRIAGGHCVSAAIVLGWSSLWLLNRNAAFTWGEP